MNKDNMITQEELDAIMDETWGYDSTEYEKETKRLARELFNELAQVRGEDGDTEPTYTIGLCMANRILGVLARV